MQNKERISTGMKKNRKKLLFGLISIPLLLAGCSPTEKDLITDKVETGGSFVMSSCVTSSSASYKGNYLVKGTISSTGTYYLHPYVGLGRYYGSNYPYVDLEGDFDDAIFTDELLAPGESRLITGGSDYDWGEYYSPDEKFTFKGYSTIDTTAVINGDYSLSATFDDDYVGETYRYQLNITASNLKSQSYGFIIDIEINSKTYHILSSNSNRSRAYIYAKEKLNLDDTKVKGVIIASSKEEKSSSLEEIGKVVGLFFLYCILIDIGIVVFFVFPPIFIPKIVRKARRRAIEKKK